MKEKWVVANWKMNLGLMASAKLAKVISKKFSDTSWIGRNLKKENQVHAVVAPSHTAILEVAKFLMKSPITIAAQDMFWLERGAYTGEISPLMLLEIGVDYVIIGHSERRKNLGETDEIVNKKIRAAVHYGLIPLLCVGETLDERLDGSKEHVVLKQVEKAFENVKPPQESTIMIAYEPVWAIGTGNPVACKDVFEMHSLIKQHLYDIFPETFVNHNIKILYGGSVNAENVGSFTGLSNVDGVLVGGASLKSKDFLNIVKEVKKS
ncbi:MAG TPA: triose-phosphate isomerase [Patescibacteria group bacterium]|nr:triose-phosphate isomerase [Patescibacteria group bacterium]